MACNGAASFSCTQCDIIMSHAASAYVPAGKHHCPHPCIDSAVSVALSLQDLLHLKALW